MDMTDEEKTALVAGADFWSTAAVPRLGVPSIGLTDGPSGARGQGLPGQTEPSSAIPTGSAVGATWDPELAGALGALVAREAKARRCGVLLAPNLNLHRDPLAGRNFECYGEDPLLAGRIGAGFIRGVQSEGVAATAKHLVCNESELERSSMSSVVDERTLRELYLVPFEIAVREAGVKAVMTAYNRVNGRWVTEWPELLRDVLRGEWGFDGVVMTDWLAVASASSLDAGVDLEMPGPARAFAGAWNDDAAERVLRLVQSVEATGAEPPEDRALLRRAAASAMVLLRNDGVLPLAPGSAVAVLGPRADDPTFNGGGSAQVTYRRVVTPRDALAEVFDVRDDADVAVVVVGTTPEHESEGFNRASFSLPDGQDGIVRDALGRYRRVVVVVNTGAAHDLPWADDVDAVLQCWYGGQELAPALSDVLSGATDPGGRLPCTFPRRLPAIDFPGENGEVRYGERLLMGYRAEPDARFPFGHGLSYTSFEWTDGRLDGDTVRVTVTNTGARRGSEVVQAYVAPPPGRFARPAKELRGFRKVTLDPGESTEVSLVMDDRWFAYWDPGERDWPEIERRIEIAKVVEGRPHHERRSPGWYADPGEHRILVGPFSLEVRR